MAGRTLGAAIALSFHGAVAACSPPAAGGAADGNVPTVSVVEEPNGPIAPADSKATGFFSGEIIYRQQAVQAGTGRTAPLPDLHYFISGAHWKHVLGDQVTALYDPSANVVHYFDPPSEVDASKPQSQSVRFEHIDETRVVLGRTCRGLRATTDEGSFVEFYDPELRVDPQLFANHHFGNWAEALEEKAGALALWSELARPGFTLLSEAIHIEHRNFDAEFWTAP